MDKGLAVGRRGLSTMCIKGQKFHWAFGCGSKIPQDIVLHELQVEQKICIVFRNGMDVAGVTKQFGKYCTTRCLMQSETYSR